MELSEESLRAALGERPFRFYPALLSTEAAALAWARAGAPEGAVVAACYQASARGRAGLEWPGDELSFSLVLRPSLDVEREGWLYPAAALGLADALGAETVEWPDEVLCGGARAGAVGVHVELGPGGIEWAVVSLLVVGAPGPQAPIVARVVEAVEARYRSPATPVLADYLRRCATIGRDVRARLIPLGPGGPEVSGRAVRVLPDGALVLETATGRRVAVRPQNLARLEPLSTDLA